MLKKIQIEHFLDYISVLCGYFIMMIGTPLAASTINLRDYSISNGLFLFISICLVFFVGSYITGFYAKRIQLHKP